MRFATPIALAAALAALPLLAATPEVSRPDVPPQAVGAAHTLRTIPEACARIEGVFTGQAAEPYRFSVHRTSATCQPRARFVDAIKLRPSEASGWKLNDVIRVPSAACPKLRAVVRVWRKPVAVGQPLDAQGRSRIYLEQARQSAAAGRIAAIPMFAAEMGVEGAACAR